MSEWEQILLGDVLTLHYGRALDGAVRDPDGSVPVYGANGIKDYAELSLTSGPVLVVGRKGSAGEVTRVEGPLWPLDVTYYTEHDAERIDFDFLEYTLRMLDLPALAKGVKPGINRNDVYAKPVSLPPLDEQKRIVAVLDQAFAALDRARANAEANLVDVDVLQSSVIEDQFDERERWSKESLGARVRFIDYRGRTPEKTESGVPLLTAKNVRMGYVKDDPREFIATEAYASWMTRGIPKRGDVLFTTEAPLANVAQLESDEPVALAQRLITMQAPSGKIDPRFLKWSLMSPQMQADIKEKGTGATVTGIKAKLLKKIPLHVPYPDRQQQIAETCEAAFHACAKLREEIGAKLADIAALRQSLLQAAFSGQLS